MSMRFLPPESHHLFITLGQVGQDTDSAAKFQRSLPSDTLTGRFTLERVTGGRPAFHTSASLREGEPAVTAWPRVRKPKFLEGLRPWGSRVPCGSARKQAKHSKGAGVPQTASSGRVVPGGVRRVTFKQDEPGTEPRSSLVTLSSMWCVFREPHQTIFLRTIYLLLGLKLLRTRFIHQPELRHEDLWTRGP